MSFYKQKILEGGRVLKTKTIREKTLSILLIFMRIIKLREGLPKFTRGFRDGLSKNFVDFMRVSREGLV